jgi:hypothetical protein
MDARRKIRRLMLSPNLSPTPDTGYEVYNEAVFISAEAMGAVPSVKHGFLRGGGKNILREAAYCTFEEAPKARDASKRIV